MFRLWSIFPIKLLIFLQYLLVIVGILKFYSCFLNFCLRVTFISFFNFLAQLPIAIIKAISCINVLGVAKAEVLSLCNLPLRLIMQAATKAL